MGLKALRQEYRPCTATSSSGSRGGGGGGGGGGGSSSSSSSSTLIALVVVAVVGMVGRSTRAGGAGDRSCIGAPWSGGELHELRFKHVLVPSLVWGKVRYKR